MSKSYDASFYDAQKIESRKSAEIILPIIFELSQPASVVDVGCGVGTWLLAAKGLGVTTLLGLEGEWVKSIQQDPEGLTIMPCNLANPIDTTQKFDLAICMEVAEHLPGDRASSLVADLCRISDIVLFSAAVPHQGGTDHVNEQWQSYWAAKFAGHGYQPYDVVRPRVWQNESVAWWYRQNALVYMAASTADRIGLNLVPTEMLDVAHPRWLAGRAGPFGILKMLPKAVKQSIRARRQK